MFIIVNSHQSFTSGLQFSIALHISINTKFEQYHSLNYWTKIFSVHCDMIQFVFRQSTRGNVMRMSHGCACLGTRNHLSLVKFDNSSPIMYSHGNSPNIIFVKSSFITIYIYIFVHVIEMFSIADKTSTEALKRALKFPFSL